jgi:frataxin-like iron-binding protein CyaY
MILTEIEQTQLTIEIAALATVKGGKIVTDKKEVLHRVWILARQEHPDNEWRRKAMNEQVVTFLAEVQTKRVEESNANQLQYLVAVIQHIKWDER